MSLFQKIKSLFALKTTYVKIKEAVKMSNHNYLSTEFLSKVVFQLAVLLGALKGVVPVNAALIATASLTALYMVLRTIYKIKNPGQDLPDLPA